MNRSALLAEIYCVLAEALAEPCPGWLAASGRGWLLYGPVLNLAAQRENHLWREALLKIVEVHAAGEETRRREFLEALSPAMLYECQHVNGRFPGPATFAVKKLYGQAGLEVEGAEMPDHASVELAFLAYLCEQEARGGEQAIEWRTARRLFIQNHAGKWLPHVARALLRSASPAWEAVGAVLLASLSIAARPSRSLKTWRVLTPNIDDVNDCTLCGFCAQVCPSQALRMREDEVYTELWLLPENCIGCRKCEQSCDSGALALTENADSSPHVLRRSERANCPQCGAPTVSQAELAAVSARLGEHPSWLDYCLECR